MINSQDHFDDKLASQLLAGARRGGCRFAMLEMVGQPERPFVAKRAIGEAELFADANGAALGLGFKAKGADRFNGGGRA
jgi:hypothetical protein